MIARKMQDSLQDSAQLSYHSDCNGSSLLAKRSRLKLSGSRASVEDILIKTVSDVLAEYPIFNARVEDDVVNPIDGHHLSIAISLSGGLVAPTIFNVNEMSLEEVSIARRDLVERARQNKLSMKEMTQGSFTISNLGLRRIHYFTPILNAPQVAILGIGQIRERPWAKGGAVHCQPVLGLSLTTDHRVIDGDPSAEFLEALCDRIESD